MHACAHTQPCKYPDMCSYLLFLVFAGDNLQDATHLVYLNLQVATHLYLVEAKLNMWSSTQIYTHILQHSVYGHMTRDSLTRKWRRAQTHWLLWKLLTAHLWIYSLHLEAEMEERYNVHVISVAVTVTHCNVRLMNITRRRNVEGKVHHCDSNSSIRKLFLWPRRLMHWYGIALNLRHWTDHIQWPRLYRPKSGTQVKMSD